MRGGVGAGDIQQMLRILDSSNSEQQHEFLETMKLSDPVKASLLKARLLNVERIYSLDDESLSRIIENVEDDVFGLTVSLLKVEDRKRALELVDNERRKNLFKYLKESRENPERTENAKRDLIAKVRELEAKGKVSLGAIVRKRTG